MTKMLNGLAGFVLALVATTSASAAAEITVWTASALAKVLHQIGPQFEAGTGNKLNISEGLRDVFIKRIDAGESFDVLILPPPVIDALIKQDKISPDTRVNLARSGIGVEVRAGAPKPDIGSVEAFKRTLLNAKSIAYLRVGSGEYIHGMIERLGIADAIKAKVVRPATDTVSEMVAKGEVELGMVVNTQIVTTPGVELVGPLPAELQSYLIFTGGVSSKSKAPSAARDLLKFLTGPIAIPVIRSGGMEPG